MSSWLDFVSSILCHCFLIAIFLYTILPVIVKFMPAAVAQGAFLNLLCIPKRFCKLHLPQERFKIKRVKNHYVFSGESNIGVWHVAPHKEDDESDDDHESLASAEKVILYCHGNAGHRGFGHRKFIYEVFTKLGYHVVAFDYRGFGDSHGWPSEEGVVEDTVVVYNWIAQQLLNRDCQIFVWGHSLGSAIATQAVLRLQATEDDFIRPAALILESAFTSAAECITEYPLAKYVAKLYPGEWMTKAIENALSRKQIHFMTEHALPKLSCHVLILHAEDDPKVPFKFGRKLFETLSEEGVSFPGCVTFVAFKASHAFGHCGIYKHPNLPTVITEFEDKIGEFSHDMKIHRMEL